MLEQVRLRDLGRLVEVLVTLALAIVVATQLWQTGWHAFAPLALAGPLFWLVFALDYLHGPVLAWFILRRRLPINRTAAAPILGREALNALLIPYSGDALLYRWARGAGFAPGKVFAVLKDSAIASALAGSLVTLALVIPLQEELGSALGLSPTVLALSLAALCAIPAAAMLVNRALGQPPLADLPFLLTMHMIRAIANTGLIALMWALLLPEIPLATWLLLAAARAAVARLPFVAQKDLALAALTLVLLPGAEQVAAVTALTGGLLTLTHGLVWLWSAYGSRAMARPAAAR